MFELVKEKHSYISKKDNKEHYTYNVNLVLKELGIVIPIKPVFDNDRALLQRLAKELQKETKGE